MRATRRMNLIAILAVVSARSPRLTKAQKAYLSQVQTESDSELFGLIAGIVGKVALNAGAKAVSKLANKKKNKAQSDSMSPGSVAAAYARAQVGKGYSQSARLGPKSFDCSGLVYT